MTEKTREAVEVGERWLASFWWPEVDAMRQAAATLVACDFELVGACDLGDIGDSWERMFAAFPGSDRILDAVDLDALPRLNAQEGFLAWYVAPPGETVESLTRAAAATWGTFEGRSPWR